MIEFKIDGIDFSSQVEVAGYRVKPRKVKGSAEGYLLDGSHVSDILAVKKDLRVSVVATEQAGTSAITTACLKDVVSVSFSDPITNTNLESEYEPEIGELSMAIESGPNGETYWYGFTIDFMEK